jgi:phosphatidylserine decarboxylase
MTTVTDLEPPPGASAPAGVQPGGHGWCVRLELAWAACRRALIRRFWLRYARRMHSLRQGRVDDCPHDVIDSRDLKYVRNVCGIEFDPHDDPYRGRDHTGIARHGWAEIVGYGGPAAVVAVTAAVAAWLASPVWLALAVPAALAALAVVLFFRDPHRTIPADPDALVSPADGRVTHIDEIDAPDFPGGRARRISIFLSVFDVHVNRMPCEATVEAQWYFPGEFLDARHSECSQRNERNWLELRDRAGRKLRVVQVSGAIARRIVCWPRRGERLAAGERFGLIKFGSRTELLWPAGEPCDVHVKVGDRVRGGETVLARWAG